MNAITKLNKIVKATKQAMNDINASENSLSLDSLAADLLAAKKAENAARKARIALEEQIASLAKSKKDGRCTTNTEHHKIVVANGFNYSVDWENFSIAMHGLDACDFPTKIKRELDVKKLAELQISHPTIYTKLVQHVTTKPKKTSVTVTEISD